MPRSSACCAPRISTSGCATLPSRCPASLPPSQGTPWCVRRDGAGTDRVLWLLTWLDGAEYSRFRPHSLSLAAGIGDALTRLDRALRDFSHPALRRDFKWNLLQADWIGGHLEEITDASRRAIVERVLRRYLALKPALLAEPPAVIHNDLNDFNLLISHSGDDTPAVTGIIDFGDMMEGSAGGGDRHHRRLPGAGAPGARTGARRIHCRVPPRCTAQWRAARPDLAAPAHATGGQRHQLGDHAPGTPG